MPFEYTSLILNVGIFLVAIPAIFWVLFKLLRPLKAGLEHSHKLTLSAYVITYTLRAAIWIMDFLSSELQAESLL
jgi:hypothetical protein